MQVILVAAAYFEAKPTLDILKKKKISCKFFELGIGPFKAAKCSEKLMKICSEQEVFYIGSCGSFQNFSEISLIQASKVLWCPPCLRTGIASADESWYPPINLKKNQNISLENKIVLTSSSISLSSEFNCDYPLPNKSLIVENMELYFAAAALNYAKSLTTILAITNACCPQARLQWSNNHKQAADLTAQKISSLLEKKISSLLEKK